VPDGVNPGEALTVEVPVEEAPAPTPSRSSPSEPKPSRADSKPSPKAPVESKPTPKAPPKKQEKPSAAMYANLEIPSFKGPRKGVTANSVNANARWNSAGDLFSAIPSEGLGREAGEFLIGQLVQVTRSDGSWSYGKIMDYDPTGDVYTVMTKAGPKYFVERDCITEDVVVNPGDGSCAQQ